MALDTRNQGNSKAGFINQSLTVELPTVARTGEYFSSPLLQ